MDKIPEKQTGLSTAVFNGIFYSGDGIGGVFISNFGWMPSYFAIGIIEAVLSIVWLLTVKAAPVQDETETFEKDSYVKLLAMPKVWLLIVAFLSTTFVVQAITVDLTLFSIIVFSNRCGLKKVAVNSGYIKVIQRDQTYAAVRDIWKANPDMLSDEQVDEAVKQSHIESIEKKYR